MPTESPELLTAQEVSARFRVATSTVYRWARTGLLTPVRIGKTVRYQASEVEAYVNPEPTEAA